MVTRSGAPFYAFTDEQDADAFLHALRVSIKLSLKTTPVEVRQTCAGRMPKAAWMDYDMAEKAMAEHIALSLLKIYEVRRKDQMAGGSSAMTSWSSE
jgi:hypothetical protein